MKSSKETPPVLRMTEAVLRGIVQTIGSRTAESGGLLGGKEGDDVITHFHYDNQAKVTSSTYTPSHEELTKLLREGWNPEGIRLRGVVHSHPSSFAHPSGGDMAYAKSFLDVNDELTAFTMPIVTTFTDTGRFSLKAFVVVRGKHKPELVAVGVEVVSEAGEAECHVDTPVGRCAVPTNQILNELVLHPKPVADVQEVAALDETFARVKEAYDLVVMQDSRVVCIGVGGASGWLEDLARAGLGQFVLVDHDTVSETNLATQQTYRRDLGRKKVDCIAERIRDINPKAYVIVRPVSLDELDDDEVARLARTPLDGRVPRQVLLCGMTDSFEAQARVNRLALKLGLPSLAAQVYKEGRAAEVTFTHPETTTACHRCALGSRYRHQLGERPTKPVTSQGTPIFATTRLNALKGFVALALLHHGSTHQRWGGLLARVGKRNLVQVRMDPDIADVLGLKVFDQVFSGADRTRLAFDEVVWLPQDPENPTTGYEACPDCGGHGDLRSCIGTFADTRVMPKAYHAMRVA